MIQPKESNSKTHFWISLFKSVARIAACYFLFYEQFGTTALLLAWAEVLGIGEEIF